MLVIGLTGSIGMGKTTIADYLAACGIPVFDADAAVHRLYQGPAAHEIENSFPGTVIDGAVDRKRLGKKVIGNPEALQRLEAIIHPKVKEERTRFLHKAAASGSKIAVLEIPLLFETGADKEVDITIVVSAGPDIQRQRALTRPDMTEDKFRDILASQIPDAEKCRRADFIVDTGQDISKTYAEIDRVIESLIE